MIKHRTKDEQPINIVNKNSFLVCQSIMIVIMTLVCGGCSEEKPIADISENNQKECCNNLMMLSGAVEQCRLAGVVAPKSADIFGPSGYIKKELVCPTVKLPYMITKTDNPDWKPTCPGSIEDHIAR